MFKIRNGFIIRKIGGQIMAVPTGKMTSEIHGMISLSESGELLWNVLVNGAEIEALADVLVENYEIDRETALSDSERFVSTLKKQGVLE